MQSVKSGFCFYILTAKIFWKMVVIKNNEVKFVDFVLK